MVDVRKKKFCAENGQSGKSEKASSTKLFFTFPKFFFSTLYKILISTSFPTKKGVEDMHLSLSLSVHVYVYKLTVLLKRFLSLFFLGPTDVR